LGTGIEKEKDEEAEEVEEEELGFIFPTSENTQGTT